MTQTEIRTGAPVRGVCGKVGRDDKGLHTGKNFTEGGNSEVKGVGTTNKASRVALHIQVELESQVEE